MLHILKYYMFRTSLILCSGKVSRSVTHCCHVTVCVVHSLPSAPRSSGHVSNSTWLVHMDPFQHHFNGDMPNKVI